MKNDMNSIPMLRNMVQELFKTAPRVHLNVAISHPKVNLLNEEATITGVYNNIFTVEEFSGGNTKRHTLQYADLITRCVEIIELHLVWEETGKSRK